MAPGQALEHWASLARQRRWYDKWNDEMKRSLERRLVAGVGGVGETHREETKRAESGMVACQSETIEGARQAERLKVPRL